MPQDVEVAVIHGVQNTLGLLILSKSEAGMYRADRIIQFPQQVVGIVERSVGEDIHLGGFEDADAIKPFVQLVDDPDLIPEVFDRYAASDFQTLGMVGYTDI